MRARRVDANLSEIVKAARAIGMLVHVTNADWDATVQYAGITELWECKTKSGKFTDLQKKLKDAGWKIRTVRNLLDVVQARREMVERATALGLLHVQESIGMQAVSGEASVIQS